MVDEATDGNPSEALSSEVLKLKIDDLFQEIETIKRRLERLEGQPTPPIRPASPPTGVSSDPDSH